MAEAYFKLINQLMEHEGFRPTPYEDAGRLSIGFGHQIQPGEVFPPEGITKEQGYQLLLQDVQLALTAAQSQPFFAQLSPTRQNVMTEMIFNLGAAGFGGFRKTISALEAEDYETAANEMLDSKWAGQVKGRSRTLADQMRKGTY